MLKGIIENTRRKKPLVHNITNYVTVNDCANILLACGASPIMADDVREVEEIVSLCQGLVLNIGTLNERTVASMIRAGRKANALGIPVILDPVGAGASTFRTQTAHRLLGDIRFSVIRGNISEMLAVGQGTGNTKGVDADEGDLVSDGNLQRAAEMARGLSKSTGAIIAVTGEIDIIVDGSRALACRNGHPEMGRITGTGCMLSSIVGAYAAANQDRLLEAAAASVCAMGICGELAYEKARKAGGGIGTMRINLIDEMGEVHDEMLESRALYALI